MKQSDKRLIRKAKRKARRAKVKMVAERIERAEKWIADIEGRLKAHEAAVEDLFAKPKSAD